MKLLYVLVICLFLVSCGGNGSSNSQTDHGLQWNSISVATYSDGTTVPVLGYKVYCSSISGYSNNNLIITDVGLVTKMSFEHMINGTWYCSVTEYDSKGESFRSSAPEIKVIWQNGNIQ